MFRPGNRPRGPDHRLDHRPDFIDLEYTACRTLRVIGYSKTMMMTNPKPYREWKTLHREGRLVLKNPKPEKELGAVEPYTLTGVGRVRLCEPLQARQKGRSYKRPELRCDAEQKSQATGPPPGHRTDHHRHPDRATAKESADTTTIDDLYNHLRQPY